MGSIITYSVQDRPFKQRTWWRLSIHNTIEEARQAIVLYKDRKAYPCKNKYRIVKITEEVVG